MPDEQIIDKQAILTEKRRRLQRLVEQQAKKGIDTEPHIITEIEDLDREIKELEISDHQGYILSSLPLPLEKYDDFCRKLALTLPSKEEDPQKFRIGLLASLCSALGASFAIIVRDGGSRWEVVAKYDTVHNAESVDMLVEREFQGLFNRAVRYQEENKHLIGKRFPNVTMARHLKSDGSTILIPFLNLVPTEILVINGIQAGLGVDTALSALLGTIVKITMGLTVSKSSQFIQLNLFNSLRRDFGYVSDYMYNTQFLLFQNQLKNVVMHFEPIISLSHYPYICRWEALARDSSTRKAPSSLFETAELWGPRFQLELDIYCLQLALESYRNLPKRDIIQKETPSSSKTRSVNRDSSTEKILFRSRVGDLLPLSVNVYPETVVRKVYRNVIFDIAKERLFPLDKLTLEISEKLPLPKPIEEIVEDEVKWFRDYLKYYTNLGVTFAIDDYGIGFASASRLSRLEPAMVKIDRDALLHRQGTYTIQHVLQLVQESMGKMQVVVEGFDDESVLSIGELYQMGIRYVQGHAIGEAVPAVKMHRLDIEQEDDIVRRLGLQ